MANITKHGLKRANERAGIHKSQCKKIIRRVLKEGIYHSNTQGELKKFIDRLFISQHNCNKYIFWGDSIYLFRGQENPLLITVVKVPQYIMDRLPEYINTESYSIYCSRRASHRR